jgi:hypothetical protein
MGLCQTSNPENFVQNLCVNKNNILHEKCGLITETKAVRNIKVRY